MVNGSKFEVAIAMPGIPCGLHYEDKGGLVSVDTDHTPIDGGNVELKVNVGQFEQRFNAIDNMVALIHSDIQKYLGGLPITQILLQMSARIDALDQKITALEGPKPIKPEGEVASPSVTPDNPSRCTRVRGTIEDGFFCGIDGDTVWKNGSAEVSPFLCLTSSEKCKKLGGCD